MSGKRSEREPNSKSLRFPATSYQKRKVFESNPDDAAIVGGGVTRGAHDSNRRFGGSNLGVGCSIVGMGKFAGEERTKNRKIF